MGLPALFGRERSIFTGYAMYIPPEVSDQMIDVTRLHETL
jgi:hypothetical protein